VAVGGVAAVQTEKPFGHLDNFLLLAARQLGDFLENLLEPAFCDRLFGLHWLDAQKRVDAHAQSCGHFWEHLRAGRLLAALPEGDIGKRDIELLSELAL
jgi:hypothetical protein